MGGKGAVIDSPVRSDDNLCALLLSPHLTHLLSLSHFPSPFVGPFCVLRRVQGGEGRRGKTRSTFVVKTETVFLSFFHYPRFYIPPSAPPPSAGPECPICHWLNGSLLYTCFKIDNHIFRLSRGDLTSHTCKCDPTFKSCFFNLKVSFSFRPRRT
jgi:hypothetical protein